jgi:hypothetical protein
MCAVTFTAGRAAACSTGYPQVFADDGARAIFSLLVRSI